MSSARKKVIATAALLLALPILGWIALLNLGLVATPGEAVEPPFNNSDRISTIEVIEGKDGALVARFKNWEEGDPELTPHEFYDLLLKRQRNQSWLFMLLDVTSWTGVAWVFFGFLGQAVFMARMIVQWQASEKARSSVVPPVFWWLSLLGSSMLMVYFIWRWEIIGFLGQSTGWFIYIRNLWFIYGKTQKDETEQG
ncbi:MAG: lipid-A-disaccharide synthase N-terminal domain-containing protein [Verrucomicrobiales bacterium]|nr:lipid-A-disaccharide synthase N-terminal domain-containing protein [Verrucomicrobiales bacterium]